MEQAHLPKEPDGSTKGHQNQSVQKPDETDQKDLLESRQRSRLSQVKISEIRRRLADRSVWESRASRGNQGSGEMLPQRSPQADTQRRENAHYPCSNRRSI